MSRPGLRRTEVVVGLLAAVVAVGMLLTGVQRVREAAAAVKCQNNLKQLGLATHNYIDSFGKLPPLVDQGEGTPTGRGLPSVFVNLIPFLEATPEIFRPKESPENYYAHSTVAFEYGFKKVGTYEGGETYTVQGGLANRPSPIFLDPADSTADGLRDVSMTLPDGAKGFYATGNYVANGQLAWGVRGLPKDRMADTILFSERPQVCRDAAGEVTYNLWGLGFYSPHMPAFAALTPDEPPGLQSTGQVAPVLPLPDEAAPDRDSLIRVRIGRQNAGPVVSDFATPIQRVRPGRPCDPRLPGSPHRGGLQAAMADGSVRVFAYDTSPWVFWSACAPAGK